MPKLFVRTEVQEGDKELLSTDVQSLRLHWRLLTDSSVESGTSSLEEFPLLQDIHAHWPESPQDIVAIIPGDEVLLLSCEVPGRSAGTVKKALPYALEEYVAGDIENLHIAHEKIRPGQPVKCALISKQRLSQWQECFSRAAISPGNIVSEGQLLSAESKSCALVFGEFEVMIATNDESASVARSELLGFLSNMELEKVICVGGELTDIETSQLDANLIVENDLRDGFEYLVSRFTAATPINLLQGEYKVARPANGSGNAVVGIFALLGIWLIVTMTSFAVEGYWAESRANELTDQATTLYKEYFPTDSAPVTTGQLTRRLKAKLGTQPGLDTNPQGFVDLLSRVSGSVTGTNKIQSLRFNHQRMELTFEVLLPGFNELDPLKERSASQGVLLKVTNADNDGSSIRARLSAEYN
ncbi:MAG: type II secretion system protein GspL [Pseudomonadales bacterium]